MLGASNEFQIVRNEALFENWNPCQIITEIFVTTNVVLVQLRKHTIEKNQEYLQNCDSLFDTVHHSAFNLSNKTGRRQRVPLI